MVSVSPTTTSTQTDLNQIRSADVGILALWWPLFVAPYRHDFKFQSHLTNARTRATDAAIGF